MNLVVPDPDLSKYVSLEQLGELLQAKANVADVPDKTDTEEGIRQAKELAQEADAKAQNALDNKADKTAVDAELAKKDDITDVDAKINSNVTKLNQAINTKANASDVYTKPQIDTAFGQRDTKIGNNTNVINTVNEALKSLIPDDTHAPALPAGFDLNNYFIGWRRSVNTTLKNMPFGWLSDTMYFQGTVAGSDGRFEIALYIGNGPNGNPKIAYRFYGWDHWKPWVLFADNDDISNLQNAVNSKADKSQVNVGGSLFRMVPAGKTWSDILGFDNGDTPALVAFRGNTGGAMDNLLGNYSAGVAFGGGDTKGFLEVSYEDHNARIGGGNGNAPVWHEDIAWKSDVNDLRNQVQQLRDNQFEVQTFTDATAAANWEAQRPGKRMAIVNS